MFHRVVEVLFCSLFVALIQCVERCLFPSDEFGWSDLLFVEVPGGVIGMVSGGFGGFFISFVN
jgi:hypothetical protein